MFGAGHFGNNQFAPSHFYGGGVGALGATVTTTAGGHVEAAYCDFAYLGDTSNRGWYAYFNGNYGGTGADWKVSLTHCTLDHCGEFYVAEVNTATSQGASGRGKS